MYLKGLNKKIQPVNRLDKFEVAPVIAFAFLAAATETYIQTHIFISSGLAIAVYFIGLAASTIDLKVSTGLALTLPALLIDLTAYLLGLTATVLTLGLYYLFQKLRSQEFSLLAVGILAHFGDAVTTFLGVSRGLYEMNPFPAAVMRFGDWTIFPVKALVLPVAVYIYFHSSGSVRTVALKSVLVIGVYISLRNLILISLGQDMSHRIL